MYNADDSVLNEDVSKALSRFLPVIFEGKFEEGREPEMEWVCLSIFGVSWKLTNRSYLIDWDHGQNKYGGPICKLFPSHPLTGY